MTIKKSKLIINKINCHHAMAQGDAANVTLKVLISIGDKLTSNLGATTGWWSLKAPLAV